VLVEARRLDVVPADVGRAGSFLRQAEERLDQLPLLTSVVVRYGIAYDACHDTGEALLAAYGFRTTNGPGQHEALGRYLRAVFDKPPADRAAREFDRPATRSQPGPVRGEAGGGCGDREGRAGRPGAVRRRPRQRYLAVTRAVREQSARSPEADDRRRSPTAPTAPTVPGSRLRSQSLLGCLQSALSPQVARGLRRSISPLVRRVEGRAASRSNSPASRSVLRHH
jgi:hypothetical protein